MKKRLSLLMLAAILLVCLVLVTPAGQARDLTKLGLKASYDLKGATVTYISWTADRIKTYLENDPVVKGRLKEAEKFFNCKFNFLQTRDIPATNMARLMAGDSAYDIWNSQTRIGYYELVSAGAAYPMGDILPAAFYKGLSHQEQEAIKILAFKGKTYGIGSTHWGLGLWNVGSMVTFYNKTLIDREGLPDPYALYKENKWTWERCDEIVRKATKDTNGDGEIDQFGIYRVRPFAMMVANGGATTRNDRNGRPVFAMDEPAALEALQLYADWKQIGAVGGRFVDGNAALDMHQLQEAYISGYTNMKDVYSIVPIPMGPRMNKYVYPHWSPEVAIVPINSANPEAMAAINAFLFREQDVPRNLVLARHVRTREGAEVFTRIQKEWAGETKYLYEAFGGATGMLVDQTIKEIINGEKTPAVGMAEIKPIIQGMLDEVFYKK